MRAAGWGWCRVGGGPAVRVLDFQFLVWLGGGLPKQRGVAGRVHEDGMVVVHGSPAWWGRRTMPNIICSAVDLAETRKPPRKRLNGLTA